MPKSDFTKTSAQVERDIVGLIDAVDRSLDSSSGESERKGQLVFSAFLSLLVVFCSILGFDYFVKGPEPEGGSSRISTSQQQPRLQGEREMRLVAMYLQRIDDQSKQIRDVKGRVAPSMPIEGQLDLISGAVADMRGLVGIPAEDGHTSPQPSVP